MQRGSYTLPKIVNNTFQRRLRSNSTSDTIFAMYYNNVAGTIIPLQTAFKENPLFFPYPSTGIPNTETFTDYFQSPFEYFTGRIVNGSYTYPTTIQFFVAPTSNTFWYVEDQLYTHNSTETKTYFLEINYSGNGLGTSTPSLLTFYVYKNGVELTRIGQYSASAYGNRGSVGMCLITLDPNDTQEIRYSQAGSTDSSGRIRNFNVSLYELKN